MRYSRVNLWFWALMSAGALLVGVQSVALFGWLAAPMGMGTGASLGLVVFYLASMLAGAARWAWEWLKRS